MPKRLVVINFKQLVELDILSAVEMLAAHTLKSQANIMEVFKAQGAAALIESQVDPQHRGMVYKYLQGEITETAFIEGMIKALDIVMSPALFITCWQEMSRISSSTHKTLQILQRLQQDHKFAIFVAGNTDAILAKHWQNFNDHVLHLEFVHSYSYETRVTDAYAPWMSDSQWADYEVVDLRNEGNLSGVLSELKWELSCDAAMADTPRVAVTDRVAVAQSSKPRFRWGLCS